MAPGAVRTELGISRDRVARWAGCGEALVALYEARPESVGERKREAIAFVYEVLGEALTKLQRRRARGP